jgi:hypothetical protein
MKTSLHFEAPSDLSVGTIRTAGGGQTIADWIATPNNRTLQQDDLKPGIYSAEIGPAGVAPRSVVFEIKEGQANNVVLPTFSALSSAGSNTTFFDTASQRTVSEIPSEMNLDVFVKLEIPLGMGGAISSVVRDDIFDPTPSQPVNLSKETRRISIGLSEEKRGWETFDAFRGQGWSSLRDGSNSRFRRTPIATTGPVTASDCRPRSKRCGSSDAFFRCIAAGRESRLRRRPSRPLISNSALRLSIRS